MQLDQTPQPEAFIFMLGSIPVYVQPSIKLIAEAELDTKAVGEASYGFTAQRTVRLGYGYTKGKGGALINTVEGGFEVTSNTIVRKYVPQLLMLPLFPGNPFQGPRYGPAMASTVVACGSYTRSALLLNRDTARALCPAIYA